MKETKVLVECGVITTKFPPPSSRDGTAGRVQKLKECRCARCRYCVKSLKSLVFVSESPDKQPPTAPRRNAALLPSRNSNSQPPSVGGRRRIPENLCGLLLLSPDNRSCARRRPSFSPRRRIAVNVTFLSPPPRPLRIDRSWST